MRLPKWFLKTWNVTCLKNMLNGNVMICESLLLEIIVKAGLPKNYDWVEKMAPTSHQKLTRASLANCCIPTSMYEQLSGWARLPGHIRAPIEQPPKSKDAKTHHKLTACPNCPFPIPGPYINQIRSCYHFYPHLLKQDLLQQSTSHIFSFLPCPLDATHYAMLCV